MRLVTVLRVSSDRQAERGLGLDVQEQSVRRWARENGHKLVSVYREEGVSGRADLGERPALLAALTDIAEKRARGLLVARLDRLARALTVQEAVLGEVWRHDGAVFSADTGEVQRDNPDDPMLTFVRQVMGAAAQLDRSLVVSRMRAGRRLKAERGGYAFGAPPFGYRAINGRLVPVKSEQAAIRKAIQLRDGGASLREVAEALTAEGYRPRKSDVWHSATIGRILARTARRSVA
jgi:DNA invertase Pin-like site-specific DNA recombinase